MSVDELIERWWTPTGRKLAREVFRYLQGERVIPEEVGLHIGRADLRGIGVPSPEPGDPTGVGVVDYGPLGSPWFKVNNLRWEGLDLSHAWLRRLQATRLSIIDCLLDHANCRAWRMDSSTVNDSSFAGADLVGGSFLTLDGSTNEFTATVFDGAKMSGVVLRDGAFLGCTFEQTILSDTRFHGTRFSNCTFSGVLRDVIFDDRARADRPEATMTVTDFKDSMFVRVQFRGCRLDRVELPPGVYVVADFPRVAARADLVLQEIGTPIALALRNFLGTDEAARGTRDSVGVVNRADFVDVADQSFADLVEELLVQASAQAAIGDDETE